MHLLIVLESRKHQRIAYNIVEYCTHIKTTMFEVISYSIDYTQIQSTIH